MTELQIIILFSPPFFIRRCLIYYEWLTNNWHALQEYFHITLEPLRNSRIDRTKQEVCITFQISRRVFLDFSATTIHAQRRCLLPNFIPQGALALADFRGLFKKSSFKMADSQSKTLERKHSFLKKYWSIFPRRICLNLVRKGPRTSVMPWS